VSDTKGVEAGDVNVVAAVVLAAVVVVDDDGDNDVDGDDDGDAMAVSVSPPPVPFNVIFTEALAAVVSELFVSLLLLSIVSETVALCLSS
jgi:hypothetical protein